MDTTHIEKLEQINHELAHSAIQGRRELLNMGFIKESTDTVYRAGSSGENAQTLPFKRLYLPCAFTGILEPKKAVDETHIALQILLPGAGTTFSTAETLCDIAGTFHGRKSKNRGKQRESNPNVLDQLFGADKKLRVASFPTDLPLNGMGSDAPFEFASKRGLMAVIRHVHLVLSKLYPKLPVFVGGRSQGGISAILYAQHYQDVSGAIAINPPHPDPELFQYTITYLEDKADTLSELLHAPGVSLHQRSWDAYKRFTPSFNYPKGETLAPILTFVSLGDTFNLFPKYAEALQAFADQDEKHQIEIVDAGHNLWDRKSVEVYKNALFVQTQFILKHMQHGPVVNA